MAGIKEVARLSGVSPATVSQVLGGGKRPVSAETRTRVIQTARSLGYRPNAIARGLVKKRMNTMGVVIQHAAETAHTNPALGAILDGILAVGTRRHQYVTLVTYRSWEETRDAVPALCDGRCDGVLLVVPPQGCGLMDGLLERGLPFVVIGAHSDDERVACVDVDNVSTAQRMAEYVLALGHRRLALVSDIDPVHQFVGERVAGFRRALEKAGLVDDPSLVIITEDLGKDLTTLMMRPQDERPTALFCVTDSCALSVLHHLSERGLSVPEDISVVGFDDVPAAAVSRPPLTTLRQPMAAAGERAAEMLLAQINGDTTIPEKLYLPTELIVRQSVAKYAVS
jgi:LacI family transcriptional regulator